MKQGRGYVRWLFVLAFAAAGAAQAMEFSPVIKAGWDFGGDTMASVVFTDGSRDSIKANEGLYFGGGVSILNDARTIETELSLSYKFEEITASNGNVKWTRMPVEALVFYRLPKFRVGGGATYHLDPKLKGSGVVGGLDVKFDNALGLVVQGDYLVTEKFSAGLRYTSIDYKATGGFTGKAKGDGLGLTIGYRF